MTLPSIERTMAETGKPDHTKPLTAKQKAAIGRRACRAAGAAVVMAMAQSDTSLALIAKRRGISVAKVRAKLLGFIDGTNGSLSDLSDLMFCCGGAAPEFSLHRDEVETLKTEIKHLKRDIDRYVQITGNQANQIARLSGPVSEGERP